MLYIEKKCVRQAKDVNMWSNVCQHGYIIELAVPWEDAVNEAYERKKLRHSNLAAEAEGRG